MIMAVVVAVLLAVAGAGLLYMYWTGEPDPGRHRLPPADRRPVPAQRGEYPYPPLRPFPAPSFAPRRPVTLTGIAAAFTEAQSDPYRRVNPSQERLATTGEFRSLAYAGDIDTIKSEIAAWQSLRQLDEWIN